MECAEKTRSMWNIASDLEDVLTGLERAQTSAYILLEIISDEFLSPNNYKDFYGKKRLEDYTTALYLVEDRIFDERKRLENLTNELFSINRTEKKSTAPPPPRKRFNNNNQAGEGAGV